MAISKACLRKAATCLCNKATSVPLKPGFPGSSIAKSDNEILAHIREAKSGFPSEYLDEIRGMGPQWLVSRGEGPIQGRFTDRKEVIFKKAIAI